MNRIVSPFGASFSATRISWGAVFVGVLLSVMTYLFLSLLGAAIGAGAIDPAGQRNPLSGFGKGTSLWMALSTLISIGVGGFFAGRSAPDKGILHGILSWSVMTIGTLYLLSSMATGIVGAASNVASGVVRQGLALAGNGVAGAVKEVGGEAGALLKNSDSGIDLSHLQKQIGTLLHQTGKPERDPDNLMGAASPALADAKGGVQAAAARPDAVSSAIKDFFQTLQKRAEPAMNAADKDALIKLIATHSGKSQAEAEKVAGSYEKLYQETLEKYVELKSDAEQKARQAAAATAAAVGKAAWAGAILYLLGGVLAGAAGHYGRRSTPETATDSPASTVAGDIARDV